MSIFELNRSVCPMSSFAAQVIKWKYKELPWTRLISSAGVRVVHWCGLSCHVMIPLFYHEELHVCAVFPEQPAMTAVQFCVMKYFS